MGNAPPVSCGTGLVGRSVWTKHLLSSSTATHVGGRACDGRSQA